MTFHCYNKWTFNDPIDDCPIEEIAIAVKHHGLSVPIMYGIWTDSDNLIHNIGRFLNENKKFSFKDIKTGEIEFHGDNPPLTLELIRSFVPDKNLINYDKIVKIIVKVLEYLQLFNKSIPIVENIKPGKFKSISIPIIKGKPWPIIKGKPWPKLF